MQIKTKAATPEYRDNWERIFGKKEEMFWESGEFGAIDLTPEQWAQDKEKYVGLKYATSQCGITRVFAPLSKVTVASVIDSLGLKKATDE